MNDNILPEVIDQPVYTQDDLVDMGYALETSDLLNQPFAAPDHHQHYHGYWYVREWAVRRRLNDVLGVGNWKRYITQTEHVSVTSMYPGFKVKTKNQAGGVSYKESELGVNDSPIVLMYGGIAVRSSDGEWVSQDTVGGADLGDLGKEPAIKYVNTVKTAEVDLLKRSARQWGVGLYLTQLSEDDHDPKNVQELSRWLIAKFGQRPQLLDMASAAQRLQADMFDMYPDVYPNSTALLEVLKQLDLGGPTFHHRYYYVRQRLMRYAAAILKGA